MVKAPLLRKTTKNLALEIPPLNNLKMKNLKKSLPNPPLSKLSPIKPREKNRWRISLIRLKKTIDFLLRNRRQSFHLKNPRLSFHLRNRKPRLINPSLKLRRGKKSKSQLDLRTKRPLRRMRQMSTLTINLILSQCDRCTTTPLVYFK